MAADDNLKPSRSSLGKILKDNIKTEQEWLDQIKNNIENILNTRNKLSIEEYLDKSPNLTVLDFGIPDVFNKSLPGSDLGNTLSKVIEVALENFEPRITNVSLELDSSESKNLKFHISATVKNTSINLNLVLNNLLWKID